SARRRHVAPPPGRAEMLGMGADGPLATAAGSAMAERVDGGDRAAERDAWAVLAAAHGLGPVGFANLLRRLGSGRDILRVAASEGGEAQLVAASAEEGPDGTPGRRTLSSDVAAEIVRATQDGDRTLERIR